jgi:hypothetical protein
MTKTVLITGTSSGIGKASALYFAQQGWAVAATLRNPDRVQDFHHHPNIKLYALDVTNKDSIERAIAAAMADLGQIDVLVNNAGFGVDGVFEAMSDEVIVQHLIPMYWDLCESPALSSPICAKTGVVGLSKLLAWAVGLRFRSIAFITVLNGLWKGLVSLYIMS